MEKLLFNKKGLSTVVTTLIIVLLVLVAVGIIWLVVSNLIDSGTEDVEYNAKCLEVDMEIQNVEILQDGTADITLQRKQGGDDIEGIKLVLYLEDGTNIIRTFGSDVGGDLGPFDQITANVNSEGDVVESVEVLAYFQKGDGTEHLCPVTDTYEISYT